MRSVFLRAVLGVLLVVAIAGTVRGKLGPRTEALNNRLPQKGVPATGTLYVLVHGFMPEADHWKEMAELLHLGGSVLQIKYDASLMSDADPLDITSAAVTQVAAAVQQSGATKVVLVGHSVGGLLARRMLLQATKSQPAWAEMVSRVVLIAGTNRGWDLSGERPSDMTFGRRLYYGTGYWLAKMLNRGRFIFAFERGAPFVANLRLDWMAWMKSRSKPEVVQLIGDIDDIVRRDDNADLRVIAGQSFAQLRVRGSGHAEIIDFRSGRADQESLGVYRRDKFLLAVTGDFAADVMPVNEEPPLPTNEKVTQAIFVLHGIRDFGRWSTEFETGIRGHYPDAMDKVAIISPRYGYLGMGPFMFERVRDDYVRWFMDEYTETLARYPMLDPQSKVLPDVAPRGIHFFGHSNGTYLLATALQKYTSMKVDRVVFAGSAAQRAYPWFDLGDRVRQVRNYVGTDDWVVAWFPRLFELPVFRWMNNDIGSAGYNGFDQGAVATADLPNAQMNAGGAASTPGPATTATGPNVVNVKYLLGTHGAFQSRVPEMVNFLVANSAAMALPAKRSWYGRSIGFIVTVLAMWALIVSLIGYLGIRVFSAAPSVFTAWVALLLYAILVVRLLQTV